MNVEKRMEIEKKIVRHLIREAKKAGWICVAVNNGGDEDEPVSTEAEAMDEAFACDEANLYFSKEVDGKLRTCIVLIVLGNDGYDVICDHSAPEADVGGWNTLMAEVDAYAEKFAEVA